MFIMLMSVIIGFSIAWYVRHTTQKEYFFKDVEAQFFYIFNSTYPISELYRFKSMEAFCMDNQENEGGDHYFVHACYSAYSELDEKWNEIEVVRYGDNGNLENAFFLNWPNNVLEHYQGAQTLYQRAVKEGIKKTYTMEEIQEMIDKYKPEN